MAKTKLNILITAGGTREYIDPVRFIANASTGRMGYALARAAIKAGHAVTLITAPTSLQPPKAATRFWIASSFSMMRVAEGLISSHDAFFPRRGMIWAMRRSY